MLLATGPSFEFLKFLQILGWIILSVSLVALILTMILHYRKKRSRISVSVDNEQKLIQGSPELLGYTKGDGEYVFFDHSALIRDYKSRLTYNHARYAALRHDFDKLQDEYADLAVYTGTKFTHHKITHMENTYEQMPQPLHDEIAKLSATYKIEKEELRAKFEQMNQSIKALETENQSLQDQVNMQTSTDDEKAVILTRWKQENVGLREQIAGQQYLNDMLVEKKAQIEFLQNQLENRVKSNHQLEQQRLKAVTELEEERAEHGKTLKTIESLKNEMLLKQDEADKLQVVLIAREEELSEKQQQLSSKLDHLTWLENVLQETKQHNEILHASSMDDKNLIALLQEQFSSEQSRVQYLEQKLMANKQLMQRLHKDLSSFVDEENGQPPVISLRPDYINRENEEMAVQ
jgi:DNA repair exonuclease SbcCD ATPase subunit